MRHLLLLALLALSAALHGQSPCNKCAPPLRIAPRGAAPERFAVATNDLPAFARQIATTAPEVLLLHQYAPAGVAVLYCTRAVLLEKILPLPEVLFADIGHTTGNEERAVPGHYLAANNIRFVHARQPALDGSGTTVSIKEFRFDSTDADLKNRVLLTGKSAPTTTGHATIMATLVGGAGNSDPEARGVVRGSRLVSSSFVGLLPDADTDYLDFDISVQNHAYGLDIENYYGIGALAYDASTRQHPGLLHVFSAGNQGTGTAPAGPYAHVPGFANLTGNFKMAKNILTVGSVDSFANVLPFSARGPAYDGRIKPDLVAFGQNGTSEAASLVSGAAAVVRQAFFEKHDYWPDSDLLRAILLGSCDDIGTPGPDFGSGFGNLNLKKAVELVQYQYLLVGELTDGESLVFSVDLPPNVRKLQITLCWNDVPALPNAPTALTNDLDLSVVAPDGTTWHPWVLNAYPHRDSLLLPAQRGRDAHNTVEQVTIEQPATGTYQVQVHGYAVPDGAQPFALAVGWDTLQQFSWTSPVPNDPAIAGKQLVLRWQSTLAASTGVLEWKSVGGEAWRPLASGVPLGTGYWRWHLPDTTTAAQVRMRTASDMVVSDTFLIAPALRVRVDVNCPDSVLLHWTAASSDLSYRLWGLGDRYLEPLLVTDDTALVLQKNNYPQARFAVSALFPGAAETPTSGAPDIGEQGVGCYINGLLAQLNEVEQAVDLTLALGSRYGVRRIFLEKLKNDAWVLLHEASSTALQILFSDVSPTAGTNTYRARLEMENGTMLYGEPVHVYFAGTAGYLVLPNPLTPGQVLTVLARLSDDIPRLFLYDVLGRLVLEQKLEAERTQVSLPVLPPGCYVWMVVGERSERLAQGKLVVRR